MTDISPEDLKAKLDRRDLLVLRDFPDLHRDRMSIGAGGRQHNHGA